MYVIRSIKKTYNSRGTSAVACIDLSSKDCANIIRMERSLTYVHIGFEPANPLYTSSLVVGVQASAAAWHTIALQQGKELAR